MIDTHAHLTSKQYKRDLPAVLDRARAAGVSPIITVGTDPEDWPTAVELADRHSDIFAVLGLHPHDSEGWGDRVARELEALISHPKVVALGEIGLDFYRDYAGRDAQRRAFREQIRLAREVKLPIVIHSRDTTQEIVKILKEENAADIGGVIHCLPADPFLAREAEEMGLYVSLAGNLTYDKQSRDGIIRSASPDRLLVETDCPYLTPHPMRTRVKGRIRANEPAFVQYTLLKLAEVLLVSPKEADELTTRNAMNVFRLNP